ncbi:MAG TPA: hypothetical protein VGQ73_09730 [Gemmatimonadales bacterium]|jgi:hypothetical protein|nr:hypothetical protein [Gemmatimonadales bacterium]
MLARTPLALALIVSPLATQTAAPPPEQQIAAAVSALPGEERAGATVLGYDAAGKLVTLRKGTGLMTCLGHDPKEATFHVACYHNSMEPFMARGRALRASGVKGEQVDSVRFREVRAGTLPVPKGPALMYQYFGGKFDPASGEVSGAQVLYVVYIPFATALSTGLSAKPSTTAPWIMFPGTPKAHIMFTPKM